MFIFLKHILILVLIGIYYIIPIHECLAKNSDLTVYPQEQQAFDSYKQFKDVAARKLVSEVLKNDPKSPVSYYVMGLLTREGEGDTTKALHYFNKALKLAVEVCGSRPRLPNCVKWHSMAMYDKIEALRSLDRYQEAYDTILQYDELYIPHLDEEKIWPLIKMRKLVEAETVANQVIKMGKSNDVGALNSLCVLAAERNQRVNGDKVCEQVAAKTDSMVIRYNTAIAKFSIFDHRAAERYALDGTRRANDMFGTVWEFLIYQYTLEERYSEALSAAKFASNEHRGFSGLKEELSRAHYLIGISQLLLALWLPFLQQLSLGQHQF